MKFRHTFFLLSTFFLYASCKSIPEQSISFYEALKKEPCEYRKISSGYDTLSRFPGDKKEYITYQQLLSDLETFSYLVESSYAGYEKALSNGFDLEKCRKNIIARFSSRDDKDKILCDEFAWSLWKETFPYIRDMHFQLFSEVSYYSFAPHKKLYFSNSYVKKTSEEGRDYYYLFLSDSSQVKVGELVNISEENLFYYPSRGLDLYRIGAVSEKKLNELTLDFLDRKVQIPLEMYESLKVTEPYLYKESESEKSAYIYISTFNMPEKDSNNRRKAEKIFKSYANFPEKYIHKENIILDLRGNEGGNMNVSLLFPINLYLGSDNSYRSRGISNEEVADFFLCQFYRDCFILESPGTLQNSLYYIENYFPYLKDEHDFLSKRNEILKSKAEISFFRLNEYTNKEKVIDFEIPEKSAYTGKIIIIADSYSASASEDLITFTKMLFKNQAEVILLGENTAGCMEFGGIYSYQLENSKIVLNLAQTAFYPFEEKNPSWKGEGAGLFPDIWTTNSDLNETLKLLCN